MVLLKALCWALIFIKRILQIYMELTNGSQLFRQTFSRILTAEGTFTRYDLSGTIRTLAYAIE